MLIYRLHRAVREAADYTGAVLAGGRWNSPGTPMLYASQHLSLACLEILVHLDKTELPLAYVWSSTELLHDPEPLETENPFDRGACRARGGEWVQKAGDLARLVRSIVIAEEFNVILNPKHHQYGDLIWSIPHPFRFDTRLFTFEPRTD